MPKKLGMVYTSLPMIEPLNTLAREMLPGVEVVNIIDDSLLPYARIHGVDDSLRRRMRRCFEAAVDAGADVILSTCSSVGETVDTARPTLPIPLLKIDEPMAEAAVRRGRRLAVLATVASTLGPTCRLLESKALESGRTIHLTPHLCDGALDLLIAGRTEDHDRAVITAACIIAEGQEALVLAQASMARLVPQLGGQVGIPVFASPRLAMLSVAALLGISERAA